MMAELNLRFPDDAHVIVRLGDDESGSLPFKNPLTEKDHDDIQWYVEVYGARSLADPDEEDAKRIAGMLPVWGKRLFDAVFGDPAARNLFNRFRDQKGDSHLLTISAEHPVVLGLPWELLHDSLPGGVHLFFENPGISIRRGVAGATGGRETPLKVTAKDRLHLLFVVSRPKGVSFIDPRADPQAVLDALDTNATGRVTCEFLRPATLDALTARLRDENLPPVDVLHFDGHGVFDRHGGMPGRAEKQEHRRTTPAEAITRKPDSPDPDQPPNTGYLLFERDDGRPDFVAADRLGENLHRCKVALVILSACQSAAVNIADDNDDDADDGDTDRPMGSVAARLTATGIPAVLAMTHSVLVPTTRALFGQFYQHLAGHRTLGESLDAARRYLKNHPKKYEVQRESGRAWLKLHDWFLPALYQTARDVPLLKDPKRSKRAATLPVAEPPRTNLPPEPEAGFFGRRRELWWIERWFADQTRRITLTGFGGQGKTALSLEAGRWLTRTGQFRAAVLVDYSRIQALDAVAVAVGNIATVLDESLPDVAAATEALKKTPTLVILDNLEALGAEPLRALLDAAVDWSTAGGSRVLCTTRRPEFDHSQYRVEGTFVHRRIQLDGLGDRTSPDEALDWFARLSKLPPEPTVPPPAREAVIELFDRVRFHPLSIRVLAQQLKTRRTAELGERLEELLSAPGLSAAVGEDTPAGLLASLQLSLDRLDDDARRVLPRLGVFQGGACEDDLLEITGLGESDEREKLERLLAVAETGDVQAFFQAMGLPAGAEVPAEMLAKAKSEMGEWVDRLGAQLAELPAPSAEANLWPGLRRQLEAAALIEAEDMPGVTVPFLRFHPTLAPLLWAQLDAHERTGLSTAHRQRYAALAGYLYREDRRNPHQARAIAMRELPNLLSAVHAALDAADPDAGEFTDSVNRFLGALGFKQESEALVAKAQAAAGEPGSHPWYLAQSNRGDQLLAAGRVAEAAEIFQTVLAELGDAPSYERAVTLERLGRCFRAGGRPDLAAQQAREAIAVLEKLEQTDNVKRHRGVFLTDLADALAEQGRYAEARKAYEDGLEVDLELGDLRGQGVTLGQLGTLAMLEGNLGEAAQRYEEALKLFQQLREPASESVIWHQLGMVFQEARQWDEAERHYRESARIEQDQGNLAGAALTWNQLATVNNNAGRPEAAESWYRKAIEAFRTGGDQINLSKAVSNLAALLRSQPGRLAEARELAEEALAIDKTLDPGAAEIWTTYNILAKIAEREAAATGRAERQAEAREYRRLAREAKRDFAGTRHELRRFVPLILGVVGAVGEPQQRAELEQVLPQLEEHGFGDLVAAIRQILDGQRDEEALCDALNAIQSMVVETILAAVSDPSTLKDLLPDGDA